MSAHPFTTPQERLSSWGAGGGGGTDRHPADIKLPLKVPGRLTGAGAGAKGSRISARRNGSKGRDGSQNTIVRPRGPASWLGIGFVLDGVTVGKSTIETVEKLWHCVLSAGEGPKTGSWRQAARR